MQTQVPPSENPTARVFFRGGQYVAVGADNVFEAVAQAFGARSCLRNTDVVDVHLDILQRYRSDPAYV
jgi:hypothetical protein